MEEELKCPLCKQLYVNPVLLPCYHALCISCALDNQIQSVASNASVVTTTAQVHQPPSSSSSSSSTSSSSSSSSSSFVATNQHQTPAAGTSSSSTTDSISSDQDTADKVSILSEADSGVICTSRPSSYAGTPNLQALLFPPSGGAVYSLTCPICRKIVFFDDGGARNLPPYRTMESIIDRFCERESIRCQMVRPRDPTTVRESVCVEHCTESLSVFCLSCKLALCNQCLGDNRHQSHEIQSIATICKTQKVNHPSTYSLLPKIIKVEFEWLELDEISEMD